MISLGPGTADRIRLLVEDEFGPGTWDGFQGYMAEPSTHAKEWRFGGTLGFGGKVHYDGRRLYVSAYLGDLAQDPFMERDILEMNERLEALLQQKEMTT
jgi:hypothetical protein